ncbi:hypothetical protein GQ457_16G022400 [Hibiscus cannabinus]
MSQGTNVWKTEWQLPIPQRIRTFDWAVMRDCLLTNKERVRRHMTVDPNCNFCAHGSEDLIHVLRDCVLEESNGLQHGRRCGFRRVLLESDSSDAVRCINAENILQTANAVTMVIKEMLQRDWSVSVVCAGRDANKVADWLARNMREPPDGVMDLLEVDLQMHASRQHLGIE